MLREDAYRLVQSHAMRAWKDDLNFRDEVARDPEITKLLSAREAGADVRLHAAARQCGCDLQARAGRIRQLTWRLLHLTLAITGASGAILARELLRALEADERVARVHFVASENSLRVLAEELGISGRTNLLEKLLGAAPEKDRSARRRRHRRVHRQRQPSLRRHDHPALLHGHAGRDRATAWPTRSSPAPPTSRSRSAAR